jgi:hypothetical protein
VTPSSVSRMKRRASLIDAVGMDYRYRVEGSAAFEHQRRLLVIGDRARWHIQL